MLCNTHFFAPFGVLPVKNVTITLPKDLARWLRVKAAEDDRSVSRWIAELLERMRRQEDDYQVAMKRYLAMKPRKIEWPEGRKPTREELYDRPGAGPCNPGGKNGTRERRHSCERFRVGEEGGDRKVPSQVDDPVRAEESGEPTSSPVSPRQSRSRRARSRPPGLRPS